MITGIRIDSATRIPLVATVRRTISILSLSLAWLCANGALWDAVQVFAWGKMVHEYSRFMTLTQAVEITFDGSAPCEICVAVDDATQGQPPDQQVERSHERVLLACQAPERVVLTIPERDWPGLVPDHGLTRTEPVPVPPPRC